MKVGDIVKINDRSDWHGLYGVIDRIEEGMAFVFCVTRPGTMHLTALGDLVQEEF